MPTLRVSLAAFHPLLVQGDEYVFDAAEKRLPGTVIAKQPSAPTTDGHTPVTHAAARSVATTFPGLPISFLFNNAGACAALRRVREGHFEAMPQMPPSVMFRHLPGGERQE